MSDNSTIEKEESKTRLLETCSKCGKKSGTLTHTKITSWLFNDSRCHCSVTATTNSATPVNPHETNQNLSKLNIDPPQLEESYQVESLVGVGGMGNVFKAFDSNTNSNIAIKSLTKELAEDKEAVKRFKKEVETISKLDHPNIVSVYGQTETKDKRPCFIMDYIEGKNLAKHLRSSGKLNQSEGLEIFIQIAEALDYAHKKGVIHRDLKPTNVMVENSDYSSLSVKLLDFGIAKVIPTTSGDRDTQDLTKTGEVFGSPAYMSPEQCMGFKLDERSDIYSFGCLMYEIMTGHPPFQADNPIQLVVKHLSDQPTPWSGAKEGKVLEGLEAVVFKCLEKEQEDRYQRVSDLLKDLKKLKEGRKLSLTKRTKEKAELSAGQGAQILGEIAVLSFYWIFASISYLQFFAIVPAFILPAVVFLLFRHLKKYGFGGSGWKQWELLSLIMYTLIAVTAIPVFIGFFGISETFPMAVQYAYASFFLLHFLLISFATATRFGAFFFSSKIRNIKAITIRYLLVLVPLLIVPLCNFGGFSQYFAPSLSNKLVGNYHYRNHRIKQSTAAAQMTIAIDSKNGQAYEVLAENLLEENKPLKALETLNSAISNNAYSGIGNNDLYDLRAKTFISLGDYENALQDINTAIDILKNEDSSSHDYWISGLLRTRSEVNMYKNDYKKALLDINEANKLYDSRYESDSQFLNRMIILAKTGDSNQAISKISNDIQDNMKNYSMTFNEYAASYPKLVLLRALIYENAGDTINATKDYRAISALDFTKIVKTRSKIRDEALNSFAEPINSITNLHLPPDTYGRSKFEKALGEIALAQAFAYHKLDNKLSYQKALKEAEKRGLNKSDFMKEFQQKANQEFKW